MVVSDTKFHHLLAQFATLKRENDTQRTEIASLHRRIGAIEAAFLALAQDKPANVKPILDEGKRRRMKKEVGEDVVPLKGGLGSSHKYKHDRFDMI